MRASRTPCGCKFFLLGVGRHVHIHGYREMAFKQKAYSCLLWEWMLLVVPWWERLNSCFSFQLLHTPKLFFSSRGWFSQGSSSSITGSDLVPMDSDGGDRDRISSEKWSLFGPRAVQKSTNDPGMCPLGGEPFSKAARGSRRWQYKHLIQRAVHMDDL